MRAILALTLAISLLSVVARAETSSDLGYSTVASALTGLQKKDGVRVSRQGGWTVIDDRAALTLWSFTPEGHPAHPAVIQRTIVEDQGNLFVQMHVLCEATKPACDNLVADFGKLNQQMTEDLRRRKQRN
jgi:hypothetical protein